MDSVTLMKPQPELLAEFRAYLAERIAIGEKPGDVQAFALREDAGLLMSYYANAELGVELPFGFVPFTVYWLVRDDGRFIGEASLRHYLTPLLEEEGGHIGYAIRPCERGRGHGTCILSLMLEKARDFGLSRVLLTCDACNRASARVIEKNGGVLTSQGYVAWSNQMKSRYWIEM